MNIILRVENLEVFYPIKKSFFLKNQVWKKAVNNISFEVKKGETFAIVGESGCGKTSIARALIGLEKVHSGKIFFKNKNLLVLSPNERKKYQKDMQMIFQDPFSSLNPRMRIIDIITEALVYFNKIEKTKEEDAEKLLEEVGLSKDILLNFPHELSGGQCQRVSIARAISTKPDFIICDEAVSSLDVSVQAQIINLLKDLQEKHKISYLFISHNLSVVNNIANKIAVMNSGEFVETGNADEIIFNPQNPYTKDLIAAIPKI